jgi:hypothetical protein
MKWAYALAVWPLIAADAPHLFYSKSFPGSSPAYVEITVDRSGAGAYKEAPDDPQPLEFHITAAEADEMFALAEKLGRFTRPLEAPERALKIAFMGMKTFRFVNGSENHEVKFNFSEDNDARQLQDWFERVTETEQHRINLERAARYDKLGVNDALLLLQSSFDHKRLIAPEQLLPVLDRIAKNETYVHMARVRAAGLADAIRAGK